MRRFIAFVAALVLVLLPACGPDYGVKAGKPKLVLSATTIDFNEVVVGQQATIGVTAENDGMGTLDIEDARLADTTSANFDLLVLDKTVLNPGESTEIKVRYVPDGVSTDVGMVSLTTNDPDHPYASINLVGSGVVPEIDVDPDTLWFGVIEPTDSLTRQVTLTARGSGSLKVNDITLSDDIATAYSVQLPNGVTLPYVMSPGLSFTLDVTFAPPDANPWEGSLIIKSNAPHTPEVDVSLLGNSEDDPNVNAEPVVQITNPNWGDYFIEGDETTVTASVYDQEDPPSSLACILYADNTVLGSTMPDSDGNVTFTTTEIPAGDVTLTVKALDSEGGVGEDSVDVVVWASDQPVEYTISGGDTPYDYWSVDDDVTIYLNGTPIFSDTDGVQDIHPPVTFEAEKGDTIRITATDEKYCTRLIDALTLHFGTDVSQPLNDAYCLSACDDHSCYDPDFNGPWPETFLDKTYTIEIP